MTNSKNMQSHNQVFKILVIMKKKTDFLASKKYSFNINFLMRRGSILLIQVVDKTYLRS